MEAYDFLNEKLKPIIKGDYQDFSSKKVEGYSLFVSEHKKPHVQAMVREDILELLQNIEVKYSEVTKEEANLYKSQISRWYVNGFTDTYNGCRRNDLKHLLENHDYLALASKFKLVEDLNIGSWNKDKFRKYTINLGRHEGILFYVAERKATLSAVGETEEKSIAEITLDKNENNLQEVEDNNSNPDINTNKTDSTLQPINAIDINRTAIGKEIISDEIQTSIMVSQLSSKHKTNRGRKAAFANQNTLAEIIEYQIDKNLNVNCNELAAEIFICAANCQEKEKEMAPLVVAMEKLCIIPILKGDKVKRFCEILCNEHPDLLQYRSFTNHYNVYSELRDRVKDSVDNVPEKNLQEIIDWKKLLQEILKNCKKS